MQIAWDDAQKLVKRQLELGKGHFDAAEDLSELSEGEKEKGDTNTSESHHVISRIHRCGLMKINQGNSTLSLSGTFRLL